MSTLAQSVLDDPTLHKNLGFAFVSVRDCTLVLSFLTWALGCLVLILNHLSLLDA